MDAVTNPVVRRRAEPPSDQAEVVLAPTCGPPTKEVVTRAVEAAGDGTIAVVVPLRIHGSAWGFPNPGLMPTQREKDAAQRDVEATIAAIKRAGGQADGQITATRNAPKVIAGAALRRNATLVIVEQPPSSKLRIALGDDVGTALSRRLRARIPLEVAFKEEAAPQAGSRSQRSGGNGGRHT